MRGVPINGLHEVEKNQKYALNVKVLIGISQGGGMKRSQKNRLFAFILVIIYFAGLYYYFRDSHISYFIGWAVVSVFAIGIIYRIYLWITHGVK